MLQCKKCSISLFENSPEEEFGEVIVICSTCGAKNILAPLLIDKVFISIMFEVIGYRE